MTAKFTSLAHRIAPFLLALLVLLRVPGPCA
jgi:hypothetical protein